MSKEKNDFKPFIPTDKVVPEFTPTALVLGIILAVVFGAANAYLGLRVGMTVSASIPAAVISMGVIRFILKKDSILENNMVQTIGSAGESLAAGAIFTLPALYMWAREDSSIQMPSFFTIAALAVAGGVIGTLFMIPLRTALIVEEHGNLPFPEGTACAEGLLAGEEGGSKSKLVFSGLGISALYKFVTDGLILFPSEISWDISVYKGSAFGLDVLPALIGVGYICVPHLSLHQHHLQVQALPHLPEARLQPQVPACLNLRVTELLKHPDLIFVSNASEKFYYILHKVLVSDHKKHLLSQPFY